MTTDRTPAALALAGAFTGGLVLAVLLRPLRGGSAGADTVVVSAYAALAVLAGHRAHPAVAAAAAVIAGAFWDFAYRRPYLQLHFTLATGRALALLVCLAVVASAAHGMRR